MKHAGASAEVMPRADAAPVSRGTPVPLSPTQRTFPQWLRTSNVNNSFLQTQISAHTRKYQWAIPPFQLDYSVRVPPILRFGAQARPLLQVKNRLYMLTEDLKGFVQRMDQTLLEAELPSKTEFVVTVKLTKMQRELYHLYRNRIKELGEKTSVLAVTNMIQRIGNHPDIVKRHFEQREKEMKDQKRKKRDKASNPSESPLLMVAAVG